MKRTSISMRQRHAEFCQARSVSISPMTRKALDNLDDPANAPTEHRARESDKKITTVLITEHHCNLIAEHGINLSAFVGDTIQNRIDNSGYDG